MHDTYEVYCNVLETVGDLRERFALENVQKPAPLILYPFSISVLHSFLNEKKNKNFREKSQEKFFVTRLKIVFVKTAANMFVQESSHVNVFSQKKKKYTNVVKRSCKFAKVK